MVRSWGFGLVFWLLGAAAGFAQGLRVDLQEPRGGEQVRGEPGDVIYIPRGSHITFGTPSRARFVYVAFPADWNKG